MRLVIKDPDGIVSHRFCMWLITQIRRKYFTEVKIKKYSRVDDYLLTLALMERHKGISSHNIVQQGLSNLIVSSDVDSYSIHINDSIFFDSVEGIKLSSMCKLINYGTLSVKGYPIITELFTYYANNIDNLLKYYYTYVAR
jgi:hypothetical protein